MHPPEVWTRMAQEYWHASLEAAVLTVLVLAVQRLFQRWLSPRWRHALWILVLVRLCVPFSPPSPLSWERLADRGLQRMAGNVATAATSPPPQSKVETRIAIPIPANPRVVADRVPPGVAPRVVERTGSVPEAGGFGWRSWLVWGWLLVSAAFLVRLVVANGLFGRLVRSMPEVRDARVLAIAEEGRRRIGIRQSVRILESNGLETPCLYGLWRPRILMPKGLCDRLSDSECRHVLMHELAHLKRRDLWFHACFSVATCLHWFNPIAWLAATRCRRDREVACDALALEALGVEEASAYGGTVLKLVTDTQPAGPRLATVGILENRMQLKQRISMIGSFGFRRTSPLLGVGVLVILACCSWTARGGRDVAMSTFDLARYCDFPNYGSEQGGTLTTGDAAGAWYQAPQGRQNFWGVPFSIRGMIRLAGERGLRDGWSFRPEVRDIEVNREFDRLYLLHATYYNGPENTPVARLWLSYADGGREKIDLLFGYHVRNWHRHKHEFPVNLRHTESRVAWTGHDPGLARYGKSVRLCLTSLRNPRPGREVRSIDLESAMSGPSAVIFGMTFGGPDLPEAWSEDLKREETEHPPERVLVLRAVDSKTGQAIPGFRLDLEAAEEQSHFYLGHFVTDARGRAEVRYPAGDFPYFDLWASGDGYVPKIIHWDTRVSGPFPAEYSYRAEPGRVIGGKLVDPSGRSIPQAVIEINGPPLRIEDGAKEFLALTRAYAVTDSAGRWQYGGVPNDPALAPQFTAIFRHPAFQSASVSGPALTGPDVGETLTMSPGIEILGSLVDRAGGTPRGTIHLDLSSHAPGSDGLVAHADAQGQFALRNAPSLETLVLTVQADGYAPQLSVQPRPALGEKLKIPLDRGFAIQGRVLDQDSQPVSGAQITVESWQGLTPLQERVESLAGGEFSWPHAPDGEVVFLATHPDFLPGRGLFVPGKTGVLVTRLIRPVRLTATVVAAQSKTPIIHGRVFAVDPGSANEAVPVAVVHEGTFSLALNPSAGARAFRVESPGYVAATLTVPADPVVVESKLRVELREAVAVQ